MYNEEYENYLKKLIKSSINPNVIDNNKVDELLHELLTLIPNKKLYKYRAVNNENIDALENNYIWMSTAEALDDLFDSTINIDFDEQREEISSFIEENSLGIIKATIDLQMKKIFGATIDEKSFQDIIKSYTKEGRLIKSRARDILQEKYGLDDKKISPYLKMIEEAKSNIDYEKIEKLFEDAVHKVNSINMENRRRIKVFSMSSSYDNEAMWGLYSDSCHGYCIEYDFNRIMNLDYMTKSFMLYILPVIYSQKKEDFSLTKIFYIMLNEGEEGIRNNIELALSIYKQLLTKNKESWENQKEWRIFNMKLEGNKLYLPIVSAVYIGARMKQENINKIIAIATKNKFSVYKQTLNSSGTKLLYEKNIL